MEEKRKDPKEKKCAICGKEMYAGEEWAYKRRIGSERTKWFCSYKCMRAWDAKHEPKQARPAGLPADLDAPAPKEPVSRAVLAKALAKEIKAGHSVIEYMKAEGYKNPWEAYNSVRHYCETKMPELAEVLKPLKELQKAKPAKMEKVPDIEQLEEQVAEQLNLQGGVNYQLNVDEAMRAEENQKDRKIDAAAAMTGLSKALSDIGNRVFTKEKVLQIVDQAVLDCQAELAEVRESKSGDTFESVLFQTARAQSEDYAIAKLRKKIRKMLGAEEE